VSRWVLLIGDKWRRIIIDGGEQVGRCLTFLDTGTTKEEDE
jgi:hypothetical protein